jgi:phosphoglycolate phosphatase-like HAD superfamily hydrolase
VKLLLFDIDGTLVLTGGAGVRALNRAFVEVLGVANAMERIRPHGKTDPAIIREIFEVCGDPRQCSDFMAQLLDAYVRFLPEEVSSSATYRVLPGIVHFLDEFHQHPDLALGLATGNVERGARIKLERGNLNRYFPFGGFGSDAESRTELVRRAAEKGAEHARQSVAPEDVFVIGDTPRDIHAGREAGFRTVGVATSDYSADDLNSAGADLVLSDFERDRNLFLNAIGISRSGR